MKFAFSLSLKARRLQLVAITYALSLAFFVACNGDGASNSEITKTPAGPLQPRTAPPLPPVSSAHRSGAIAERGWTFLDGRRAKLSDYRGQAVVLDFWATYCPPCREEIPHLIALQRRYGSKGLSIVGLNVGGDEDRLKVPSFAKELGVAYPLGDPDNGIVDIFLSDNDSIPQTYVFDRQGTLVRRFIGYDETMPAELERAVQTALAVKAE